MRTCILKLADRYISINHQYDYLEKFCEGYIITEKHITGKIDFSVEVNQQDIEFEREKSAKENEMEGIPVIHYPEKYLETLSVYRKIAEKMPEYDTILFHGSVIAVDQRGYLFTAKSGTGKSTHTRLWREYFGERAVMVNDDKPLLRITERGVIAYGTPWNGKHRLGKNLSVPLDCICALERGRENTIKRVQKNEIYPMIVQQTYRCSDMEKMGKTLSLIDKLTRQIRFYKLSCNMEQEAAKIAYEGMQKEKQEHTK